MRPLEKTQSDNRERTLLTALLLSAPGPLVTGMAALAGQSATQTADFLRRTAELGALFASWWIYRKIQGQPAISEADRLRLEGKANLAVAVAMTLAGIAMLIVGTIRLFVYEAGGNGWMGMIIASLGLLTNSWFWLRYRQLVREHFDAVIAGQERLYRAKALVDLFVVVALLVVLLFPDQQATQYMDAAGCLFVAGYLLHSSMEMVRKNQLLVRQYVRKK